MTRVRLAVIASFSALCLWACAAVAPALGASVTRGKVGHRRGGARRSHACARSAGFRTVGGHTRRSRHPRHRGSCFKRHSGARHGAGRHLRRFRHSGGRHPFKRRSHTRPGPINGSACVYADITPTPENLGLVRAATLCLINRERAARGEPPLRPNARLARAAQGHSENMASGDYFEHRGRPGDTPLSRIRAAGYIFSSQLGYELGENIAYGTLWKATPRAIVAAWMASPEHRANILDGHFRDTAIGVAPRAPSSFAHGQAGAIYTQEFGVLVTG